MPSSALPSADIIVIGAGVIGLSIALELRSRGAEVAVVERGVALAQASTAAAGMLAAHDPHNPLQLQQLSDYSLSVYDDYLERVQDLSGLEVPYQTESTMQYMTDGTSRQMSERSIDPRQLAPALLNAVRNSGVVLRENKIWPHTPSDRRSILTTGAWAGSFAVRPRKGQMLRVQLPTPSSLTEVHRAEHIYVVPRTRGPQAGTALIGATVEDTGFDLTTHADKLNGLREQGANLHQDLDFLRDATTVEAWAGLRPSTPDDLPVIGQNGERELVATGHFRNGILLAPATAMVVADLVQGRTPQVSLAPFAPGRFSH